MGQHGVPDESRCCAQPFSWQPCACMLAVFLATLTFSVLSNSLDASLTKGIHLREPAEMALAGALAAELLPDEDEDEALAQPLKKPPAVVNTKPGREQEHPLREPDLREPHPREPHLQEPARQKHRVAYMVFVNESDSPAWQDALAVLVHGMRLACQRSAYEVDILALAPERIGQDRAQQLQRLGFHGVVRRPIPINASKSAEPETEKPSGQGFLVNQMGLPEETIKYWVLTMAQYHRVLLLDADAMIFSPADELFEAEAAFITAPRVGPSERGLPPLEGGFLLVRPSETDFQAVKDALRAGHQAGPSSPGAGARLETSRFGLADARAYGVTLADGLLGDLEDPAAISAAASRVKSARFGGACGRP